VIKHPRESGGRDPQTVCALMLHVRSDPGAGEKCHPRASNDRSGVAGLRVGGRMSSDTKRPGHAILLLGLLDRQEQLELSR